MNNQFDGDPKDEKIFELNQELKYLRERITYLQEELASSEDDAMRLREYCRANDI